MKDQNPRGKMPKKSTLSFIFPYLIILGVVLFLIFGIDNFSGTTKVTYNYSQYETKLDQLSLNPNSVTSIEVRQYERVIKVTGIFVENNQTFEFTAVIPEVYAQEIYDNLVAFGAKVKVANAFETSLLSQILPFLIPSVLMILVVFFLMSKSAGGNNSKAFDFGKSPMKNIENSKVKFDDVAGCDEEKDEMKELVDYLKNPKRFTKMGARVPKGVLLKGAPGTGKTLLAKAVAGEAGVPFFSISGSDFVEMFVGVGASRVRDMFRKAQQYAPSMIFIDEIDAVGRQRGAGLGGGHDEREQTLNQLLVEMDGFQDNSGIIVIAATNRPDVLDPALLRPGRFDRIITVNLPDRAGREAILKVHARNKKIGPDVNFGEIASRTPGFSGAELENVLNEAAILAVRNNKDVIVREDIDEAIDRVMGGPAKKNKRISEREKKLIAYHESGHAIVGLKLDNAMKVQKVTIIPRGETGGYVLMTPNDDRFLSTKRELLDRIAGLLAGRVAEEIFFDDITTGASSDIEQATKIARAMVTELGMSNLGPIQYEKQSGSVFLGRDYTNAQRNVSSEIAFEIDKEMSKIINESMDRARKVITDYRTQVEMIAQALIEKETLTNEEVTRIVDLGIMPETKVAKAARLEEVSKLEEATKVEVVEEVKQPEEK